MSFVSELKELMSKHKVYIQWTCDACSDLHGVTGECMEIVDNSHKVLFSVNGDTLEPDDLEET